MSNVDKFLQLFSDFEMVVEPVRERTLEKKTKVSVVQTSKSCSELRKSLKRLTTEYKRAQKSFKHNKISIEKQNTKLPDIKGVNLKKSVEHI